MTKRKVTPPSRPDAADRQAYEVPPQELVPKRSLKAVLRVQSCETEVPRRTGFPPSRGMTVFVTEAVGTSRTNGPHERATRWFHPTLAKRSVAGGDRRPAPAAETAKAVVQANQADIGVLADALRLEEQAARRGESKGVIAQEQMVVLDADGPVR